MKTLLSLTSRNLRILLQKAPGEGGIDTAPAAKAVLGRRDFMRNLSVLIIGTTASVHALAQQVDKSQWTTLFEANYNNADKKAAEAQREGWSEEMNEAFDEWLDKKIEQANARLTNARRQADEAGAKAITEEQRLAENNTKALTEEQRLAENNTKAINTAQQADEAGAKAIEAEKLGIRAEFLGKLIPIQSHEDDRFRAAIARLNGDLSDLKTDPILSGLCSDLLNTNNCPPLKEKHLVAMQEWLSKNKPA